MDVPQDVRAFASVLAWLGWFYAAFPDHLALGEQMLPSGSFIIVLGSTSSWMVS